MNTPEYTYSGNTDITVRLGLEVDYFPETIERVQEQLATYPFDFLIGSVHFVDGFPIDFHAQPWQEIPQDSRDTVWRGYWRLLRATAQSGIFDIIGHFDLPKKFNFFPSADLTKDALSPQPRMEFWRNGKAFLDALYCHSLCWQQPITRIKEALHGH